MFEFWETIDPQIKEWVLIPLFIYLARMIDVMLATVRIMLVVNDRRTQASILSFFEILLWLLAVGQTLQHLSNFMCYIGFAGGFATGTFFGMMLERKLAIGQVLVRVITMQKDGNELVSQLRANNFRVTTLDAEGSTGRVNIIFSAINRTELKSMIAFIKEYNPNAFYTVESLKHLNQQSDQNSPAFVQFLRRIKMR